MDALDIFLNDSNTDKDDASKNGDGADLTIIGEFELDSDSIIIDDTIPTNLEDEHLLNSERRLGFQRNDTILLLHQKRTYHQEWY